MTTTTTRGAQQTPTTAPTGTHAGTTGSPGTSGVVAGLLMVTGIGWNAGLEARPFHPAMMGVTALVIHILPLVALMVFLVPALTSPSRRRGVSASAGGSGYRWHGHLGRVLPADPATVPPR